MTTFIWNMATTAIKCWAFSANTHAHQPPIASWAYAHPQAFARFAVTTNDYWLKCLPFIKCLRMVTILFERHPKWKRVSERKNFSRSYNFFRLFLASCSDLIWRLSYDLAPNLNHWWWRPDYFQLQKKETESKKAHQNKEMVLACWILLHFSPLFLNLCWLLARPIMWFSFVYGKTDTKCETVWCLTTSPAHFQARVSLSRSTSMENCLWVVCGRLSAFASSTGKNTICYGAWQLIQ